MQVLAVLFILAALAAITIWQAPDMLQRVANRLLARRAYILAGRQAAREFLEVA